MCVCVCVCVCVYVCVCVCMCVCVVQCVYVHVHVYRRMHVCSCLRDHEMVLQERSRFGRNWWIATHSRTARESVRVRSREPLHSGSQQLYNLTLNCKKLVASSLTSK